MASGTKIADAYVALAMDLTAYRQGLAQAKTEATSLTGQIKSAMGGGQGLFTSTGMSPFTSGIANMVAQLKSGTPALQAFRSNLPGIANDLKSLTVSGLSNSLSALGGVGTRVFNGLKSLGASVVKGLAVGFGITAFLGIEQVVSKLAQLIPDLISKGQSYAETVHALTLETGANSVAASQNLAIYQFFGGTADQFETQLVRLAARLQTNTATLNAYGVATKDAAGNNLNQIQILTNLREVFSKLGDDQSKTALLFKLFGQRGAQAFEPLIHFIGLTDAQYSALVAHVTAQGLVLTANQTVIADAFARAQNNVQNAITGLATSLFTAFGPAITSFFDNLAQTITNDSAQIVSTLGWIGSTILGFVGELVGISPNLNTFSTGFSRIDEAGNNAALTLVNATLALQKFDATAKTAKASTAGVTSGLSAMTSAVDKQIAALTKLGTAQDKVYNEAIADLNKQLDAQTKVIDATEAAAAKATADAALAKTLFDAQAQLRADTLANKTGVTSAAELNDIVAIAAASKAITDAQVLNADNVRKAQIQAVKDYITSINDIVTTSTNKATATADLLARQKTLQAGGPAAPGSDQAIELAAVLAAEKLVRDQAANAVKLSALDAKKAELAAETSAVKSAVVNQSAITRAGLVQQVADAKKALATEQAAFAANNRKQLDGINTVTAAIAPGPGSMAAAFETARVNGIAAAKSFKDALQGVLDVLTGIWIMLTNISNGTGPLTSLLNLLNNTIHELNSISNPDVIGFLRSFFMLPPLPSDRVNAPVQPGRGAGVQGNPPLVPPGHASGLWDSPNDHLAFIHKREMVLPAPVASAVRLFSAPQVPVTVGGGSSGQPAIIRIEVGGNKLVDYIDQQLRFRRR
jgi:hypothetical protein